MSLLLVVITLLTLASCGDKSTSENSSKPDGTVSSGKQNGYTVLDVDKDKRVSDIEITGMKMGKEKYKVDEPITVTVTWNGNPAEDTWIGIIPADVPHGSEEQNDDYDIDYRYFTDMKSADSFTFEITLDPGEYTMRINESDNGGAELAWCEFSVK